MFGPGGEHVVEQATYFARPIDRSLNKLAFVAAVVARMCERRHDESRLRQGKRRIVMGKVCTSTPVRHDNERQSLAFDGSVGGHRLGERTSRLRRWRSIARIPNSYLECLVVATWNEQVLKSDGERRSRKHHQGKECGGNDLHWHPQICPRHAARSSRSVGIHVGTSIWPLLELPQQCGCPERLLSFRH